ASADPPPEVVEPLEIVATLSYPRQTVTTIGQALAYTLLRTGYRLGDSAALPQEARDYLQLPLPESQRQIGPYRVRSILSALLGVAWQVRSDAMSRVVWIEAADAYAQRLAPR